MSSDFCIEEFSRYFIEDELSTLNKVSLVKSIDSTNSFLMNEAEKFKPLLNDSLNISSSGEKFNFTVKAAETQTKGRGRLGRTFVSPENTGIYFSFAYIPEGGIKDPSTITISACIGICRAIEKTFSVQCKIKWVNDIYCNGKKICGILTEGIPDFNRGIIEGCICGIGINIESSEDFSSELKKKAGGILDSSEHHQKINRGLFLASCLNEIFSILKNHEYIMEEYQNRSMLTGHTVCVNPIIGEDKSSYEAKVIGISPEGSLIVCLPDGTQKHLSSGEVSLTQNIFS